MTKKGFYYAGVAVGILLLAGCQQGETDESDTAERASNTASSTSITVSKSSSSSALVSETTTTQTNRTEEVPQVTTFAAGTLLEAVAQNDLQTTNEILNSPGYPIDETNIEGNTPLNLAVHANAVEIAKALIDHGADINAQNNISDSPYLYAGAEGRTEILAYMLEKGEPDQQKVNRFGGNALIPAAEKGHIDNVRLLLDDGRAAINFQNNYGYTALIEVVALKDGSQIYQQITQLLLERGADPAIRDNTGRTAMDYAVANGFSQLQAILAAYQ